MLSSISFGGLGIMSLHRPFAELSHIILGSGECKSTFCVVICCIVVIVLAYFTNPSESSFRAYLTERSFRQHLSQLDDDHCISNDRSPFTHGLPYGPSERSLSGSNGVARSPPFHFANRAAVSLRTPKHVFHTFGIFTIAAVVPITVKDGSANVGDRDGSGCIVDSWFIGAFGRWWRGGAIEAWYQDVVARSRDEEGWSSGILGMKALDRLNDYNGLPFSTKTAPPPSRGSPPKLRNRERPSQRQNGSSLSIRCPSPPPLPKSASLPLHTTRPPPSTRATTGHAPQSLPPVSEQSQFGSPAISRSPSSVAESLFAQSPLIADVLRQITQSKASVLDLRNQLSTFQSSSSESRSAFHAEVDSYRERKKVEDASRLELKSRIKTLEDGKRSAESAKRDAEKRLRAAESRRDDAGRRIEFLETEISNLQNRLQSTASTVSEDRAEKEQEIREALDHKKQEIKVAEDVVSALNTRARELEEKVAEGKERLRVVREKAEIRRQDRSFATLHAVDHSHDGAWSSVVYESSGEPAKGFSSSDAEFGVRSTRESSKSPRPANLSLGGLSNFNVALNGKDAYHSGLRSKGYTIFDDDIASLSSSQAHTGSTSFSPFNSVSMTPIPAHSAPLVPTGLIHPLDGSSDNLRVICSDSDAFMERQERPRLNNSHTIAGSPISVLNPPPDGEEHDPFEVRFPDDYPRRTYSDPNPPGFDDSDHFNSGELDAGAGQRRWVTKKGLNPDAKVFQLPATKTKTTSRPSHRSHLSYDMLNPNGLTHSVVPSSSSTNTSLLRAFAPSPAEREALQRALGGSTNASLEMLPTLPDVGSISTSPVHRHAGAVPLHHSPSGTQKLLPMPGWLRNLPKIKTPNFSPWDDEEPGLGSGGSKDGRKTPDER